MENKRGTIKQQPESDTVQWFQNWSDFLTKSPFFDGEKTEKSTKVIQQLLESISLGNSCIQANAEQIQALGNLVVSHSHYLSQPAPFVCDGEFLYLYRYWLYEQQLCQHVIRLSEQHVSQISLDQYPHLLSDPYQNQALEKVAQSGFTVITGGPGTGKTYTLARIIAVLNQEIPDIRIAMAAPTGKAAQRMKEALQKSFSDEKLNDLLSDDLKKLTPITIHRLLGLGNQAQPKFNEKQPLPYDVIVVDEASMLDLNLAQMLLAAVPPQARLILLGDAHQLASVEVGAVLADLQSVEFLAPHFVNLVTSRRFTDEARIGALAKFIQRDHINTADEKLLAEFQSQVVQASCIASVPLGKAMSDMVQLEFLPEKISSKHDFTLYYDKLILGYSGYISNLSNYINSDYSEAYLEKLITSFDDYRILAAVRHGALGLYQINQNIEQRLLTQLKIVKQGGWYVGRPVMMTYNDYQLGLSNGDIGICLKRYHQGHLQFDVYFPSLEKWALATRLPKSIETAFALTIHKSQGSEFTHTAVVLDEGSQNLLSKELLYTAITRAKSVVSLLVDHTALVQSLKVKTVRHSGIQKKLNKISKLEAENKE